MGRSPCCAKEGLNRGAWTAMEDKILTDYINIHGEGRWRNLPKRAGLKRCGKSCRLRWLNYLRPDIKRGNITRDEEELIIRLHKLLGNRWSLIAGRLPGRTDNEIKNYWNTNLSKKIQDHPHQTMCNKKNNKQSDNKREMKKPQPTTFNSNVVIRTKAVKCTKVFINPPPPPPIGPSPLPPLSGTQTKDPDGHATTDNDLSLVEGLLKNTPLDLPTMDFSMMGDLNFPEFLDSQQLSDIYCEFSHETNNEGEQFSPSSSLEEPIIFSEEMMDDWKRSACGLDPSMVEYWLAD